MEEPKRQKVLNAGSIVLLVSLLRLFLACLSLYYVHFRVCYHAHTIFLPVTCIAKIYDQLGLWRVCSIYDMGNLAHRNCISIIREVLNKMSLYHSL